MTFAPPPNDTDAESAVLSTMMSDSAAVDIVRALLEPDHFYADANALVYETILRLHEREIAVDLVALADELRATGRLERIGGTPYLAILSYAPFVAQIAVPARIVRRKWVERQLHAFGRRLVGSPAHSDDGLIQHLAECTTELSRLAGIAKDGKNETCTAVLLALNEAHPQPVRWLWRGWIPLGKPTILDGDPGLGKSQLTLDLVARLTRGAAMPDGSRGDIDGPANALLLSAEDDPADTIRPRLDAAGGDPTRVRAMQGVRTHLGERTPTLIDVQALENAITESAARLVVIDPLMAYLAGDSHRDQDVRRILTPLAGLATKHGAALLFVRHLNKSGRGEPLYRGGGSIGILGAARSALLVGVDPEDATGRRRILAMTKSNLAELAPSLAYHIEATELCSRVVWDGATQLTAAALLGAPVSHDERTARDDAIDWLRTELFGGCTPAKRILTDARALGIAEITLRRAATALGVVKTKRGRPGEAGAWFWSLREVDQ